MGMLDNVLSRFKKKPAAKPAYDPNNDPNDAFSPAGRARIKAEMKAKKKPQETVQVKAKPVMGGGKRDIIDRTLKSTTNQDEAKKLRDVL